MPEFIYEPVYTNIGNIARKLKGRLHFGTSPHIGGQVVDPDLVAQILKQKEGYVNAILGQIYELQPKHGDATKLGLQNDHPIVTEIVECLVIADLLSVHFQGMAPPGEGTDIGSAMVNNRKQAEGLLMMLTAGHNINIYGMMPPQNAPGMVTPQPVVLPGETFKTRQPDTLTRNITAIGGRKYTIENLGIDWGDGIGQQRRALGAEQPE